MENQTKTNKIIYCFNRLNTPSLFYDDFEGLEYKPMLESLDVERDADYVSMVKRHLSHLKEKGVSGIEFKNEPHEQNGIKKIPLENDLFTKIKKLEDEFNFKEEK